MTNCWTRDPKDRPTFKDIVIFLSMHLDSTITDFNPHGPNRGSIFVWIPEPPSGNDENEYYSTLLVDDQALFEKMVFIPDNDCDYLEVSQ